MLPIQIHMYILHTVHIYLRYDKFIRTLEISKARREQDGPTPRLRDPFDFRIEFNIICRILYCRLMVLRLEKYIV